MSFLPLKTKKTSWKGLSDRTY